MGGAFTKQPHPICYKIYNIRVFSCGEKIFCSGEEKMTIDMIDPESSKPIKVVQYTGGTISTSGSAVIPEYKPSAYRNIAIYNDVFKDEPDEKKEFNKQIREFYIEQMKNDAKKDEEIYTSQKRFGWVIFIISIMLVISGIGFSIVQLINAIQYGNYSQLQTSIEVQKAGNFVLTTSLIGGFVLIVSIVFFFLFLQYVYKPNNKRKDFFENIRDIRDPMK
jgi:uncharacterized membrane protein